MTEQQKVRLKKLMQLMNADLSEYENKYNGKFAELPHIGLGNRKTRCVNEATLPIITCHPACLTRCVNTCYVINISTFPRPSVRRCEARNTVLRRIDPVRYYEYFFAEAERMQLPIRLSDGGDFENKEQVTACIGAARRHPSVHAIGYTKRIELLDLFCDAPENVHMRYSAWEGDDKGVAEARRLRFDITEVVYDGSGNCPYQISLGKYKTYKNQAIKRLKAEGHDLQACKKLAEKEADEHIAIHHCRNCVELHCGCCAKGTIKFNVVK